MNVQHPSPLQADPAETTEVLVDQARALKAQIALQEANLGAIEAKLIARGAGQYAGSDGIKVTVVAAQLAKPGKVSYGWPKADGEGAAADTEARIRKICGDHFPKLFTRVVSYAAVDGFDAIARAIFTEKKAEQLVTLCTHQGKAFNGKAGYVLYPK